MSEWSKGVVEANGLEVFYHRSGAGSRKPSIVLLHGYTDNGLCWLRIARDLEDSFDVIMPDARGHGRTRGPVKDLGVKLLADDVAAIIRELGLEKPFVFGHSMGAQTALAVSADYPELVRATLLEDPVFLPDPLPAIAQEDIQRRHDQAKQMIAFHDLPLEERLAKGRADNPNWAEDEMYPWAEAHGEYSPDIATQGIGIATYSWREAIKKVECPILLITADHTKGAIVSPEVAQEAVGLAKRCEVAYISGAAHCIHRDRYAETLQSVMDFLQRVMRVGP